MAINIDDLLRRAVETRASDLHLKVGSAPLARIDGELGPLSEEWRGVLEPADTPVAPFVSMPLSDWGPARSVWETQRTLVVPLLTEPLLGTPLEFLRGHGAQATCWLPLTTAHRQVGVLTFGSRHADQYAADAVAFMEQVAAHVAIAVDNAINFDDAQRLQRELREERDRLRRPWPDSQDRWDGDGLPTRSAATVCGDDPDRGEPHRNRSRRQRSRWS